MKKINKTSITAAIKNSFGILSNAAKILSIERKALSHYVKRFKLEDLVEDERAKIADLAENMLVERLNEGSENMIKFVLLSLGASRGYNDKSLQDKNSKNKNTIQDLIANAEL